MESNQLLELIYFLEDSFIGEYVMTILDHTRKLPLVIEKERINFD